MRGGGVILENLVVAMLPQGFQRRSSAILNQFNPYPANVENMVSS